MTGIKIRRKGNAIGRSKEAVVAPKSDAAAKKGFKDNFLNVKFKLSDIQVRANQLPDFALFIKDDLHKPTSRNPVGHAGKYITYIKGDIRDKFFSKDGISFHPDDYYIRKNELDLTEDQLLSFKKQMERDGEIPRVTSRDTARDTPARATLGDTPSETPLDTPIDTPIDTEMEVTMDHDEERKMDGTRRDISDAIRNAYRDASVEKSSSGADSCEQRADSEEEDDIFQIGRHA